MFFLDFENYKNLVGGDITVFPPAVSYDTIISCKKDPHYAPFISFSKRSFFYTASPDYSFNGSPWNNDIDGLKMFSALFSNTYTEYALRSNKLFFYVEVSSSNYTFNNCSPSIIRSAFAKIVANKLLNGLLKHFSGMVDLIFADFSCERSNIGVDSLEFPKFRFILTFNTYFLPGNISLAFQDNAFAEANTYYYSSNHNGLDFFFNNLAHLIEPDDNCPFVVTSYKHLFSESKISDCWKSFFYLHGFRQNIVHTFFYSATSSIWLNLNDPTLYPFVNYDYGNEIGVVFDSSSSASLSNLDLFSFIFLADSISTGSDNLYYDNDFNLLRCFLFTPTADLLSVYNSNVKNCPSIIIGNNQLRLEYGLSFLVRRTLALPYIYDSSWNYCGQRYCREEDSYNYTYFDSFKSSLLYFFSVYFMLQGTQFFLVDDDFLLTKKDDIYLSFVPFSNKEDSQKSKNITNFLKSFSDLMYVRLLGVLPELRYYNTSMKFVDKKEFFISDEVRSTFQVNSRTKYFEFLVGDSFYLEKLFSHVTFCNGNFLLYLFCYYLPESYNVLRFFDFVNVNSWFFKSLFNRHLLTPDGCTLLGFNNSFRHALLFPTVGFSGLD